MVNIYIWTDTMEEEVVWLSKIVKRIVVIVLIGFTILLLAGISFYFYNTLNGTDKNEPFHLSEVETADNLDQMVEAADLIVVGQYKGLYSTVNMIRGNQNETKESTEEYLGGKVYNFHINRILKGNVEDDTIHIVHRYSNKFDIEETLGHENKEVEEADPTYIKPSIGKTYIAFINHPEVEDFYGQSLEPYLIKVDDEEQVEIKSHIEDDLEFDDTISGKTLFELETEIEALQ